MAHLAFAFCFAALYAFHLILYYYNFSDVEGLALKDYDRYLSPYYQAWMLAMLCLLARSAAARWSCCVLACAAAAVVGIFCWRASLAGRLSGRMLTACTPCVLTCKTALTR